MKRMHRWTGKRKKKHIRKVARAEAEKIVNALVQRQRAGNKELKEFASDIASQREEAVTSLARVIEFNVAAIRKELPTGSSK